MYSEFFAVKHYSADERPTLKGHGFDGLEIGETRDEAEQFVEWVNRRLRENEVWRAERDQARARVDHAVQLLTGIHSLLYPAPVKLADGRTMVFRPKPESLDPHEVLQALSDRIHALPDELARASRTPSGAQPVENPPVRLKADYANRST